ncbi:hypothetical protein LSH36_547g03015 [Paralvinella palmiformis]|uniref:Syntrophin split Pleckstrin homology (PH) domain-containing protein n=1 Tax=Paralvinella palmiformis TaxID=53620 RepID=A0AAD9J8B0_9ANNE|nr:hypothetical protein LSH36_547g03015 [Paralvinella palmiformis]
METISNGVAVVKLITMKYLREVTPYFRKSSALNDIGWVGLDAATKEGTPNKKLHECKSIPLKRCYLCRNLTVPDMSGRTIELHSPDAKNSCILRCPDEHIANQWFNALHANIHVLMQQAMSEANHILSTAPNNSGEIKYMGWLAEQVMVRILVK